MIDRTGRAAAVSVLEPRPGQSCAAWCSTEEMSVGRRETSTELVSAVARMIQDRWPEPFGEEIYGFAPLRDTPRG